jgi:lysozyme
VRLSEAGALRIANYEGFVDRPYWDVDHYSIGFGTRARSKSEGPISRIEAAARLRKVVDGTFGVAVRKLRLPLNQNQFDALVSFVFNLGPGVLEPDTTIGAALARGDLEEAADAMLLYDKSDGKPLAGLTRRRQEERTLFLKPPPVEYTDRERYLLGVLRSTTAAKSRRDRAAASLRRQAREIQKAARHERDGWSKLDRGRRYQGIRRALRKYA